jgi:hypothetical protein
LVIPDIATSYETLGRVPGLLPVRNESLRPIFQVAHDGFADTTGESLQPPTASIIRTR